MPWEPVACSSPLMLLGAATSSGFEISVVSVLVLVGVGLVAGLVNTIAGGGSFLALPALIFVGLPAPVANGTNRVAVLLQSLVGARAMYRRVPFDLRRTLWLALPAVLGAVGGAWVAARLDAGQMRTAIGVALLGGAMLLAVRPQRWLGRTRAASGGGDGDGDVDVEGRAGAPGAGAVVLLALTGFYGGFLQAGVGAVLVIVLASAGGFELLEATGAKNLIISLFTVVSLAVFALHGAVDLAAGLTMAVGSMAGAELGARLAVRGGRRVVTAAVVVALVLAGLKLLGVV